MTRPFIVSICRGFTVAAGCGPGLARSARCRAALTSRRSSEYSATAQRDNWTPPRKSISTKGSGCRTAIRMDRMRDQEDDDRHERPAAPSPAPRSTRAANEGGDECFALQKPERTRTFPGSSQLALVSIRVCLEAHMRPRAPDVVSYTSIFRNSSRAADPRTPRIQRIEMHHPGQQRMKPRNTRLVIGEPIAPATTP